MEAFLTAIEASEPARYLRAARWGYAAVNGAHILGVALLVGAIMPLNLRLLGLWPDIPRATFARILVPVAVTGLALAAAAGLLLFSVRAREYSGIVFLQSKLALVAVGTVSALVLYRAHGLLLEDASRGKLAAHAVLSIICWLGALACGRLIAFAGG